MAKKVFFYVLIRSWNSFEYFDRCIDSVLNQSFKNFKILFIDDASNYTKKQSSYIKEKLKKHIVVFNKIRRYSLFNSYNIIHKYGKINEAVIFNLDGDDWLIDKNALWYLSEVYKNNPDCLLTWGECVLWNGKKYSKPSRFIMKYTNIPYPKSIVNNNSYRKYPFLPLHPMTWKTWLFKKIKKEDFLISDKTWVRYPQDQAIFFPMLEMAPGRYKVLKKPLYAYNVAAKHSIVKESLIGTLKDELIIRRKQPYEPIT